MMLEMKAGKRAEERGILKLQKNLLKAGVSIDLIAESTGLSQAEIEQLQEELANRSL